jgi:hypothetical protein
VFQFGAIIKLKEHNMSLSTGYLGSSPSGIGYDCINGQILNNCATLPVDLCLSQTVFPALLSQTKGDRQCAAN